MSFGNTDDARRSPDVNCSSAVTGSTAVRRKDVNVNVVGGSQAVVHAQPAMFGESLHHLDPVAPAAVNFNCRLTDPLFNIAVG